MESRRRNAAQLGRGRFDLLILKKRSLQASLPATAKAQVLHWVVQGPCGLLKHTHKSVYNMYETLITGVSPVANVRLAQWQSVGLGARLLYSSEYYSENANRCVFKSRRAHFLLFNG